jgi:hypothetical protein
VDSELVEQIILIVVFILLPILKRLFKRDEPQPTPAEDEWDWDQDLEPAEDASAPPPYPDAPEPDTAPPYPSAPPPYPPFPGSPPLPAPAPIIDPFADQRAALAMRLSALVAEAEKIALGAAVARATHRFAVAIDGFVVPHGQALAREVRLGSGPIAAELRLAASTLELVLGQIEVFIGQRRSPVRMANLGDADALATSCYQPLMDFARAEGLRLTSAEPVTEMGPYDIATWTGFLPTGLAPIYLTPDFFDRVAWWPTLAHEIAHDFFAACVGVEDGLRRQLRLASEEAGRRPLSVSQGGISLYEIGRIFAGWFEEIFCDVVGTLMLGEAYVQSMIDLFAPRSGNLLAVTQVAIDDTGRAYDLHPPEHLRVLLGAHALECIGQRRGAEKVRARWLERCGGAPEALLFPTRIGRIAVPIAPILGVGIDLVTRLLEEQLSALAGYRLSDIPGVDFGPHEEADVRRVAEDLQEGRVPRLTRARPVIAGAVLAALADPAAEPAILTLARRAIPAVGTAEHGPDAYDQPALAIAATLDPAAAREAFLLHTILSPPPGLVRTGLARRATFLARA